MPNRFHPDDDIESAANIAMNGPQLSSSPATGAISRGMPSSVHSTWEDYPIQEATEIGLSVRKHDPPVFSVHRADGTRLFADRDFERVRAYLMGFRDGMES